MADFADTEDSLVATVDCTSADAKELCEKHKISGYPTLKWGHPRKELEYYDGNRNYAELKRFADKVLLPGCGPTNPESCSADEKALMDYYMALSDTELDNIIAQKHAALQQINKEFETYLHETQRKYDAEEKSKNTANQAIEEKGITLMQRVQAWHEKKAADEKDKKENEADYEDIPDDEF